VISVWAVMVAGKLFACSADCFRHVWKFICKSCRFRKFLRRLLQNKGFEQARRTAMFVCLLYRRHTV
jgi:hypothetical protein